MSSVIVIAAGVTYHLKPWWRPGLPALTMDNDLQVADEGVEGRRKNLVTILENIRAQAYVEEIPSDDLKQIEEQAIRWLQIIDGK